MLDLLDSLTSENLVLICLVLGVIALALAIGISVEMFASEKKYREEKNKQSENTQTKLNIKESADVKYVEEDRELEKTRAKIELEELREKLRREEEEKKRIIEQNLALEQAKKEKQEQIEVLEDTIVNMKPVKEEVNNSVQTKEIVRENTEKIERLDDFVQPEKIEKLDDLEKTKELVINILDEEKDEEDAIISYDELKNAKTFGYTDEEMYNNVDEEGAIISMQELEKLYHESQNITVNESSNEDAVEQERKEPSTASIYNYSKTDQDLILEQTANLEKLNEEIRKTNEFLKMLKDLKKNLD